jgi:hypothetical protein
MDAMSNVPKRNALAQLWEVINVLEQKVRSCFYHLNPSLIVS